MLTPDWVTMGNGTWAKLDGVTNLSDYDHTVAVYTIWAANGPVIKVGSSEHVGRRIASYQQDPQVMFYQRKYGALYFTWGVVTRELLQGSERYLGRVLQPLIAERFPAVPEVQTSTPWKMAA